MPAEKDPRSVWKKVNPKSDILKVLPQHGKRISPSRDLARQAKPPGKRVSKNGNVYYETRKNRSDVVGARL